MEEAKNIFLQAIDKNKPGYLIEQTITTQKDGFTIAEQHFSTESRPVYLIATGKASEAMTLFLQEKLGIRDENTICIARFDEDQDTKEHIIYASHPYPDDKSEKAAEALIRFAKNIPKQAIVLFAISGGTSALISKPAEGISIDEIRAVNKMLLNSGSSIHEINTVRKHLSAVKGGRLLTYFQSNITLIDLMISDVPGDEPEMIGSGPTITDSTTFQDAYHTLTEYNLWKKIPKAARKHIEKGLTGEVQETPKRGNQTVKDHHTFIIGSGRKLAKSMAEAAEEKGYQPILAENYYNTSVDKVIEQVMIDLNQSGGREPKAFIYYGESTLSITGDGTGGRNQAMALRAAKEIDGRTNTIWLSADSDGSDGPTDAAGAAVSGETIGQAKNRGLNPDEFIKNNDAYHFHEAMQTLIKTGPTGNNLMDVVLILKGVK